MHLHPALLYRMAMTAGLIALTVVAWLVIGGQTGAITWLVGFLLFWGATRLANRAFGGFFLGDDRSPEPDDWPPEEGASEAGLSDTAPRS